MRTDGELSVLKIQPPSLKDHNPPDPAAARRLPGLLGTSALLPLAQSQSRIAPLERMSPSKGKNVPFTLFGNHPANQKWFNIA